MRKFVIAFFVFALMFGGIAMAAYALERGKDNPIDQAGDWSPPLANKEWRKTRFWPSERLIVSRPVPRSNPRNLPKPLKKPAVT